MSNKKRYTLILNKSFQPLSVENAKKSLGYLVRDSGKALDPESFKLYTFEEWIERYTETDPISSMRSEKLRVLIPEIIVLNSNSMKKKSYMAKNISKRKVFDRDSHLCGYCGCHLNSSNRTIDHVTPVSKGGSKHDYHNVIACCLQCNSKKGDKFLADIGWKTNHKLYSPESNLMYHVPKSMQLESWKPFISSVF